MASFRCCGAAAVALCVLFGPVARAEPLPLLDVRVAMAIVEAELVRKGIDVSGYAETPPPPVEIVPPSNPLLGGNEGGYVDGRVYLSTETPAHCADLTLVHELVHDVTVKHRLFTRVANAELRDAFEALADAVTAAAADEPYRPGCLPRRNFGVDEATLAAMAAPVGAKSSTAPSQQFTIVLFFAPHSVRLSREARALIAAGIDQRTHVSIVFAEAGDEIATVPPALDRRRASAVRRLLKSTARGPKIDVAQNDGGVTVAMLPPAVEPQRARTSGQHATASGFGGFARGLMAP